MRGRSGSNRAPPPNQLRISPTSPEDLSLAGKEVWFPTDQIVIDGFYSADPFSVEGLSVPDLQDIQALGGLRTVGGDVDLEVG